MKKNFEVGQTVLLSGFAPFFTNGESVVTVSAVAPQYREDDNFEYMDWENGLEVQMSNGEIAWVHQDHAEVLEEEDDTMGSGAGMEKGQMVRIIDNDLKMEMEFVEVVLLGKNRPSFEGKLLEVNPTPEEFAQHDENFKACYDAGEADGVEIGVIYYDAGAGRAFWVEENQVEVISVN